MASDLGLHCCLCPTKRDARLKRVNVAQFIVHTRDVRKELLISIWRPQRTSDGGNGNHSVSLPIILIKNKNQSNASIFIYKLAVGLYFMILHLISYFHKCTAFLGG